MKSKSIAVLFIGIFLFVICLSGCGTSASTVTTYYWPNWIPDGRIIALKKEMTFTKNMWGEGISDYKHYIVALTIDSNNTVIKEENLFEVDQNLAGRGLAEITCSPTGEMIGWVMSGHGFENIKISNYRGDILYTITAPSSVSMKYFDWSPDAAKIVYSAGNIYTGNLYITNIDGANNVQIATSAEAVAWRTGEKIVYVYSSGTDYFKIGTIASDGSSNEVFPIIGSDPQKTDSARVIYRGYGTQVESVKIDGNDKKVLFDNYDRTTLKLSFDNTKIVGGDLITGGGSKIGGIWVTNISDGISTRIK